MFKKISAIFLALALTLCVGGCAQKEERQYELPEYSQKEFSISGFWAPYDISEEGLQLYKDAGFNTLAMINHSLDWTSEEQFYLGSERTLVALENCKKVGLKAILNYNDWVALSVENEDYYGETPFSRFDIYGEYKDIITGIHICDEPYNTHLAEYSSQTLINDFKSVYPNADYIINMIPITANAQNWGYTSYQDMLDAYGESVMSQFDNPYISLDLYPFHLQAANCDLYLVANYRMIAEKAKEYGAEKTFILQSSAGNEFEADLEEGGMRWEVNAALAFGADNLQYYCYSVPQNFNEDGSTKEAMYNYCILNADNTPSKVYYWVQEIHKEIQSYASVILSYDWDKTLGVEGSESSDYRVSDVMFATFDETEHYVGTTATHDLIVSRFTSEQYGEAYMIVNFADRAANSVEIEFKDCSAVAIYGEIGFDGNARIVELKDGKLTIDLDYGEGAFMVPLA